MHSYIIYVDLCFLCFYAQQYVSMNIFGHAQRLSLYHFHYCLQGGGELAKDLTEVTDQQREREGKGTALTI